MLHRCPVLGKADNAEAAKHQNPTRWPLLPYGDTPTGVWYVRKYGPISPHATYGVHAVAVLTPESGDAAKAVKRSGIWLHGGSPGASREYGFLRPTFGCLRLSDDDMGQIWTLAATFGVPERLEVTEG